MINGTHCKHTCALSTFYNFVFSTSAECFPWTGRHPWEAISIGALKMTAAFSGADSIDRIRTIKAFEKWWKTSTTYSQLRWPWSGRIRLLGDKRDAINASAQEVCEGQWRSSTLQWMEDRQQTCFSQSGVRRTNNLHHCSCGLSIHWPHARLLPDKQAGFFRTEWPSEWCNMVPHSYITSSWVPDQLRKFRAPLTKGPFTSPMHEFACTYRVNTPMHGHEEHVPIWTGLFLPVLHVNFIVLDCRIYGKIFTVYMYFKFLLKI